MNREDRIRYYENILDQAELAAKQLEAALDSYAFILPALRELESYYPGDDWKADFEADEQGLLPEGLKRGVLSEDGAFNVLEEHRDLLSRILEAAAKLV